jgi:uncharacterized membrane protein
MNKKEESYSLLHTIAPEFHFKDILQVMIGASILAIPIGFKEETWMLGETLAAKNVIAIVVLSVVFISAFVYYNYHRHHPVKTHMDVYIRRVVSTYLLSFLVVALIMTLIDAAPWFTEFAVALKRVAIVSFPASMSATITDVLK